MKPLLALPRSPRLGFRLEAQHGQERAHYALDSSYLKSKGTVTKLLNKTGSESKNCNRDIIGSTFYSKTFATRKYIFHIYSIYSMSRV